MNDRVVTSTPSPILGPTTDTARKRAREQDAASVLDRHASAPRRRTPLLDSAQLPTLLDIAEVADHLGVSVRHVRRLVAERRIPYVKWGNLLRFNPNEISNWLAERTVDPLTHVRRRQRAI